MCFRGIEVTRYCRKEIGVEERQSYLDLGASRWTTLCSHSLQPLRYCLESVRTEFLRLSRIFGLLNEDVLDKLDYDSRQEHRSPRKKKRVIKTAVTLEKERMRGGVGGLGQGMNPLDSFFPFDPYLLRKSHGFIEPFYKHWDGGASYSDVEDNEEEDKDEVSLSEKDYDESEDEDSTEDSASGISDSDDEEDEDKKEDLSIAKRNRQLSVASNGSSVVSRICAPDVAEKRVELAQAWSNALKRTRAPSIENGSW
jgi:RNA polymerase I-specific transcription initiation factor RRN3